MARSGKTGRKPKANKNNVKTEQNKPNKSSIPTISANQHVKKSAQTQEHREKHTQKRENIANGQLIIFSFENIEDKWIFKLFNRARKVYKLFLSEKNYFCSCFGKKTNEIACRHFEYILINVGKCKLAFQQIKQKKQISQATFSNLDRILKQVFSSRMIPSENASIKQQLCYICMLQRDSKETSLLCECSSCSHKFHNFCFGLWKSLHQNDCLLCHKRLCKETKQPSEKIELQSSDEK